MEHAILWFNILGFSLLFASIGVTYVMYYNMKPSWLNSYLFYIGTFALFTIAHSYIFFIQTYIDTTQSIFDTISIYISSILGLLLLWIVPHFIQKFSVRKPYRWYTNPFNGIVLLFAIAMLYSLIGTELKTNNIGSIFFNGYLGCISIIGVRLTKKNKHHSTLGVVIPFLYVTSFFYILVTIENIVLPLMSNQEKATQIHLFTAGLISLTIAIVTLIYMFIKRKGTKKSLSTEFIHQLSITKREQEIIPLLLQGKTNKEIGEILYISIRTVDTHIYNIYRKCSVKNKLELAHFISSFS